MLLNSKFELKIYNIYDKERKMTTVEFPRSVDIFDTCPTCVKHRNATIVEVSHSTQVVRYVLILDISKNSMHHGLKMVEAFGEH